MVFIRRSVDSAPVGESNVRLSVREIIDYGGGPPGWQIFVPFIIVAVIILVIFYLTKFGRNTMTKRNSSLRYNKDGPNQQGGPQSSTIMPSHLITTPPRAAVRESELNGNAPPYSISDEIAPPYHCIDNDPVIVRSDTAIPEGNESIPPNIDDLIRPGPIHQR